MCYYVIVVNILLFHDESTSGGIGLGGLFILWCVWYIKYYKDSSTDHTCFLLVGSVFLFVQTLLLMYWYSLVVDIQRVCGQSSCSSNPNQNSAPYNPNGKYRLPPEYYYTFCPYNGCYWGSVSGCLPNGYPVTSNTNPLPNTNAQPCVAGNKTCAFLATTNPSDYCDPGTGVNVPFVLGYTTVKTLINCPLVDNGLSSGSSGLYGVGEPICSYCGSYLTKYYGFQNQSTVDCPSNPYENFYCVFCVEPSLRQSIPQIMDQYQLGLISIGVNIGFFLITSICCCFPRGGGGEEEEEEDEEEVEMGVVLDDDEKKVDIEGTTGNVKEVEKEVKKRKRSCCFYKRKKN